MHKIWRVEELEQGRAELCRKILPSLPDWFEIPSAVEDYIRKIEA